jgi:hypothetical protein
MARTFPDKVNAVNPLGRQSMPAGRSNGVYIGASALL